MFYVSHKQVGPISHACSLKNETAIEIISMEINSLIKEQYEKENPDNFIPSDEDSVSSHRWLFIYIRISSFETSLFIPANFRADSRCHQHMFHKIQCIIFRNCYGRNKEKNKASTS